jgi:hypothetical protein
MWVPSFLFVVEPQKSRFLATLGMTSFFRCNETAVPCPYWVRRSNV